MYWNRRRQGKYFRKDSSIFYTVWESNWLVTSYIEKIRNRYCSLTDKPLTDPGRSVLFCFVFLLGFSTKWVKCLPVNEQYLLCIFSKRVRSGPAPWYSCPLCNPLPSGGCSPKTESFQYVSELGGWSFLRGDRSPSWHLDCGCVTDLESGDPV